MGSSVQLAEELFDEANWPAAQLEARRVASQNALDEKAAVIEAAAILRQTPADVAAFALITSLASNAALGEVRAWAMSECGFTLWARQDLGQAMELLTWAHQHSTNPVVRGRTSFGACILLSRTTVSPEIRTYWREHLVNSLPTWTQEIRRTSAIRPGRSGRTIWSWPGEMLTAFYRGQIAPAIGSRCTLEPSCSEYFRQACRKHGWLGFPMIGDRFIREPSVVRDAEKPVRLRGSIRFADSVDAHVPY